WARQLPVLRSAVPLDCAPSMPPRTAVGVWLVGPERRTLVTFHSGRLRRWDAATLRPSGEPLDIPEQAVIDLSPDGNRLTAQSGRSPGTSRLRDAATGQV